MAVFVCRLWGKPETEVTVSGTDVDEQTAPDEFAARYAKMHAGAVAFVQVRPLDGGRTPADRWALWRVEALTPRAFVTRNVTLEEAEIELRGHGVEVPS